MKKLVLLSVFFSLAITCGYAQTYFYKCVSSTDANGVKSACSLKYYVTFANDKGVCYFSDENGIKIKNGYTYFFRKTQNGTHVYERKSYDPIASAQSMGKYIENWDGNFLYFSSDFSKMKQGPSKLFGSTMETGNYTRDFVRADPYGDVPTF